MLDVTGFWSGLEDLAEDALADTRPRAERCVRAVAVMFSGEIKRTLVGRRTGRPYKVSKKGKLHIASAPGEPPAKLFGNLGGSIGYSPPTWTDGGMVVWSEVGVGLGQAPKLEVDPARTYARRLEFGGMDSRGIMIEARPYLAPTEERVRGAIDAILEGVA